MIGLRVEYVAFAVVVMLVPLVKLLVSVLMLLVSLLMLLVWLVVVVTAVEQAEGPTPTQ